MIRIEGSTNPFSITLISEDNPFFVDEYLQINDDSNNNPICRVIETKSIKNNGIIVHTATAKIESSIVKPVNPDSIVESPKFSKMKKYVMNTEPQDGFILGEVMGTTYDDIPAKYKSLVMMRDNEKLRKQNKIPFIFNYKKLSESPHIGLFGGSGSGKTLALKALMEESMKKNIPVILLDPHLEMNFSQCKAEVPDEYKVEFKHKFSIFTIGENIGIDFSDLTSDELANIMSFSGELSGPMNSLLRAIHAPGETYIQITNKISTLISAIEKKDNRKDLNMDEQMLMAIYGSKIPAASTLQALSWRLATLNASNIFNKNTDAIKDAMIKQKVCVIRGGMTQLNILSGYLIEKFYLLRRNYIDSKESDRKEDVFPPFIVAMDESHLFCPRSDTYSPTKHILRTISQEGRKYGVFEILATQRPSLLDTTVVSQMATKLIFRISVKDDLISVSKETDLTEEEIKRLPYMDSGECYVSSSIMGKTMPVKIRYSITEAKVNYNPFDELSNMSELDVVEELILTLLPITPFNMTEIIETVQKDTKKSISVPELSLILETLYEKGKVIIDNNPFGKSYISREM